MKVAIFSSKSYDIDSLNKANMNNLHLFKFFDSLLNVDTAKLAKGYDAVCLFVHDKADKPTIDLLAEMGIQLICLRCAGFNNVDVEHAFSKGIPVVRVPAYSPHAVAEHAVALILTLNRKTHKAYNRVREGNFSLERLTGFDLYGKTVGIIGTGKIGCVFADIMLGFGSKILAYDKFPNQYLMDKGVKYTEMDNLLSESDIISLHCPLTPETHHFINKTTLSKMRDGVMIINTSRGKLIKTADIIEALKNRKVGYLGLDVYSQEEKLFYKDLSEMVIDDEAILQLMSFPNVLITAHQAYFTAEALHEIAITTMKNIDDFENNKPLQNEVKPDMLVK